jgi:hypothetical protein
VIVAFGDGLVAAAAISVAAGLAERLLLADPAPTPIADIPSAALPSAPAAIKAANDRRKVLISTLLY